MIQYLEDRNVTNEQDRRLRELLTICFPQEPAFRERRYCKEVPAHRWLIERPGFIAAHAAVHDKTISVEGHGSFRIGGVAEVAVHPESRGRGYVRELLAEIHRWLAAHGFDFAMLLGREGIYRSSGYRTITNEIRYLDTKLGEWKCERLDCVMVAPISGMDWPDTGVVDLNGPTF